MLLCEEALAAAALLEQASTAAYYRLGDADMLNDRLGELRGGMAAPLSEEGLESGRVGGANAAFMEAFFEEVACVVWCSV